MKKTFFAGLALLIPVALTLFIVFFILNFLTHPFTHFFYSLISTKLPILLKYLPPSMLQYLVQIFILIGLFIVTVLVGALTRIFFINSFLKLGDYVINRLPFVNKIYRTTKDIIKSLFAPDANSFKKVVLAPFPAEDKYCIGLVSGKAPKACQDMVEDELTTVLLPTAPHPISGYLLMFKKKDLVDVEMTIEDTVKFIVSCGIVHPETK